MDPRGTLSGLVTVVADTILVSPPEVTKRPRNIFEQFLRKPEDISVLEGNEWTWTDDDHVPGMASLLRWVQRGSGKSPRPLFVDQSALFFLKRKVTHMSSVTQKRQYLIQLGDIVLQSRRLQPSVVRGPRGRPGLDATADPSIGRRGPRGRSGRGNPHRCAAAFCAKSWPTRPTRPCRSVGV